MRTIKFRAWDKDKQVMHSPDDVDLWHIEAFKDPNIVPMQCTGVFCRNGVAIFEGDVVKSNYSVIWEVVFDERRLSFRAKRPNSSFSLLDKSFTRIEVIGNIYENPELLSVK